MALILEIAMNPCHWKARLLAAVMSITAATHALGASEPLRFDDGSTLELESGWLVVPENRTTRSRNRVQIPWYRIRSTAAEPATPIFLLAGGPGASGLEALQRSEGRREIALYRSIADVVLFDQRGAGRSKPELSCRQSAQYPNEVPLDRQRLRDMRRQLLVECRDHWQQSGIDLSAYNTVESAADVDALRAEFGYPKITLIGGSYGSHLGLQVMRLYPDVVERAVFYGIEGPNQTWDDPDDMLRALQRIDTASQAHADTLGLRIPDGGYLASLARTIRRLEAKTEQVVVNRNGVSTAVVVDAEIVRLMARRGGAGNHDRPEKWPTMVLDLERGNLQLAAAAALAYRQLRIADPMHWSMDCSSGVSRNRRSRILRSPAAEMLGALNAEYEDLCDAWPARMMDDDYRSLPTASIPTLLFHGTWDVSTPLENAQTVAAGLRDARLVTVEGGNHGVLYNLYERWDAMPSLMRDFLGGHPIEPPARIVMPWTQPSAGADSHD